MQIQSQIQSIHSLQVGVDWLQGTAKFASVEDFFDFTHNLLPGDYSFEWRNFPVRMGRIYENSGLSVLGIRVGYSLVDNACISFCVIPGSYLKSINFDSQISLIKLLVNFQFKITRLDLAFNDLSKLITPHQLDCWCGFRYLRGFKTHSLLENFHLSHGITESLGATMVFGSRASNKYLRVYDTLPVHGFDGVRWELEVKDDRAINISLSLLDHNSVHKIPSYILGSLDFVDGKNRLLEWQKFLDYCGGAQKISVIIPNTTFDQKVEWLFRQCSKNLAIVYKVLGSSVISDLLDYGESKFSVVDDDLIKLSRQTLFSTSRAYRRFFSPRARPML